MKIALKSLWSDQVSELKYFTLITLATVLISVCPYTYTLYQRLLPISLAYGVALLVKLFFWERLLFSNKYFLLFMLFVVSYSFSILLNRHHGFFTNCGQLAYTCLYFFIFFCHYSMLNSKQRSEVLRPVLWLTLTFVLVIAGISLVMLLIQYHGTYELRGIILHMGVTTRAGSLQLVGITSGGSGLSQLCFSGILASALLVYSNKLRKTESLFCISSIVVLLLTLCAANAYAGLINLAAFGFCYTACYTLTGLSFYPHIARTKQICLAILVAIMVALCIFVGYFFIQNIEAAFINEFFNSVTEGLSGADFEELPDITIRRSIMSSIDSGRFTIWRAAIDQLILVHPLFGCTNANISVKIFYDNWDRIFYNLHNGYLTLLASAGIIGFALIILFGLLLLVRAMRFLFLSHSKKNSRYFILLFASCIGILAGELVNGCFVLWRGHHYILFWLFLGEIYAQTTDVPENHHEKASYSDTEISSNISTLISNVCS